MINGLFITGTDTGIGKTRVSAALTRAFVARGEKVAALKPVASGCERTPQGLRNEDALTLMQASNLDLPYSTVNPYAFEPAIAPHIAAEKAGVEMDPDVIHGIVQLCADQADRVIVEGVGGWQVPMDEFLSIADLAEVLGLPVIMVVGLRLGALNHAILTAEAIYNRGVPIGGFIANIIDPEMDFIEDNINTLKRLIAFPYLGTIPYMEHPNAEQVARHIDLNAIGSDFF